MNHTLLPLFLYKKYVYFNLFFWYFLRTYLIVVHSRWSCRERLNTRHKRKNKFLFISLCTLCCLLWICIFINIKINSNGMRLREFLSFVQFSKMLTYFKSNTAEVVKNTYLHLLAMWKCQITLFCIFSQWLF